MSVPVMLVLLLSCYLYLSLVPGTFGRKLETVYEWEWIDYLWNNEIDRTAAIKSGEYNYTKPVIIDVDVWRNRRVFVTVIRREGVPASLTTVSNRSGSGGRLLRPYPDWSWAKKGDCNGITSVYRIAIDECERLWVMDTGKIGDEQVCSAQLLAFDLNTDRLLKRVKIPASIAYNSKTNDGLLVTPIVETQGHRCKRTHVYVADVQGNALVVYNGTSLWRLESPIHGPQASAADLEIAGESFNLADGVLGMALSPRRIAEPRFLMFRPLASYDMDSAETSNLQNSYGGRPVRYNVASGALSSQAVAMAFSSQGILFFGLTKETALACWNIDKPIKKKNIVKVDQNRRTHQFASGLKVIPRHLTGGPEEIWMATNRYQKIARGTQDFGEVNFRIMAGRVRDLVADTNCDPRPKYERNYDRNHHLPCDDEYDGHDEHYEHFW